MINNETLFKASYKKSSLIFVFFYLEIYFPFMLKFVFPITTFLNKLFLSILKNSLFLSHLINLIFCKIVTKLLYLKKSTIFTYFTYNLNINIVFILIRTKIYLKKINSKIINKLLYFKGTLNIMHRYFVSFKTKFIIDNLSLYRYPNESNLVEFKSIINYINSIFYKIFKNLDNLISLNEIVLKNKYDFKTIYDTLVNKNFFYCKISFIQRPKLSNLFKSSLSFLITLFIVIIVVPVYNILCLPVFTYIISFVANIFTNIIHFFKVFYNIVVLNNFDYKKYSNSIRINYNSLFYYSYLIFYKFKRVLRTLNMRKFIRRCNSYICSNVLSSYWEESNQPDQCSRLIRFNIFSGMKRFSNGNGGYVDLNLKDRYSNVLEIEDITPSSVSERISDGIYSFSGNTLLSDDILEYSYLLSNDDIELSNERIDSFMDFLYKHFVYSKFISNILFFPLISLLTLFCKFCTDFFNYCFIKSRDAFHYMMNVDANIVATTNNPIMARMADNVTILLYNLYHALRLRFFYYFLFVYLLCDNLFCFDGVVYVGNTNFGITWEHSPVVMGFVFLAMIVRWLHRLISTDHNMITFGYLQYEKVIDTRHDKDLDDLSYRYSVLPTIALGTYYSTYILMNTNLNYPHLIREDVFDRVKKVWGNYSKDYINVSTEPLHQVSSDLIGLIIHYSQFPLRELYKFFF